MYVTKLKKDDAIKAGNVFIKIISTGESCARIAICGENDQKPIIERIALTREPDKNVANL